MQSTPTRRPETHPLGIWRSSTQHHKDQGFSQEAFAHACEIDRSYMGGVERRERNIALVNIAKIITALGLQPSKFFKALGQPVKGMV